MSKEGQRLNLKAGRVVAPEDDGRLGVAIQGWGTLKRRSSMGRNSQSKQYITVCLKRSVGRQFAQTLEVT